MVARPAAAWKPRCPHGWKRALSDLQLRQLIKRKADDRTTHHPDSSPRSLPSLKVIPHQARQFGKLFARSRRARNNRLAGPTYGKVRLAREPHRRLPEIAPAQSDFPINACAFPTQTLLTFAKDQRMPVR